MKIVHLKLSGTVRPILLLALLLLALEMKASLPSPDPQKRDAAAYNKAYALILDEKWVEAGRAMDQLIRDFPKSTWVDDASFWKCYAREKRGLPLEEAFKGYQDFVKANPSSAWVNDAKANMVRIGRLLVKTGKTEYEAIIKSMGDSSDQEVRLAALYALENIGEEDALKSIMDIYDRTSNSRLKEKIIFMLQDFDSPLVFSKLREIAQRDPDARVRSKALYAISDKRKPEAVRLFKDIAGSNVDPEVRQAALHALSESGDPSVVPFLTNIALGDKTYDVAAAAVFSLGKINAQMGDKAAKEGLLRVLKKAADPELRKAVMYVMGESGESGKTLSELREIIMSKNLELAQAALFQVSSVKSPEALALLKEVLQTGWNEILRRSALFAIADYGGDEADRILLDTAVNCPNEIVAESAANALTGGKTWPNRSILTDLVKGVRSPRVLRTAMVNIANRGDAGSVKILSLVVKDEYDPEIRLLGISALGQTKSDEAVTVLLDLARYDKNAMVRSQAVSALGAIGTARSRAALKEILNRQDGIVRP